MILFYNVIFVVFLFPLISYSNVTDYTQLTYMLMIRVSKCAHVSIVACMPEAFTMI